MWNKCLLFALSDKKDPIGEISEKSVIVRFRTVTANVYLLDAEKLVSPTEIGRSAVALIGAGWKQLQVGNGYKCGISGCLL